MNIRLLQLGVTAKEMRQNTKYQKGEKVWARQQVDDGVTYMTAIILEVSNRELKYKVEFLIYDHENKLIEEYKELKKPICWLQEYDLKKSSKFKDE